MRDGIPTAVVDARTDPRVWPGLLEAAGVGPALYFPLGSAENAVGTLVVARIGDKPAFGPETLRLVDTFAGQAAIALRLGVAAGEREQLAILGDRDRIARDLHDLVIQRLFAVGLQLQGMQRTLDATAQARVTRAVEDIDATIQDLRNAIFELHRDPEDASLRASVAALVDECVEPLGFRPRLVFSGPVDTVVPVKVRPQILATLREALSNVVRHARASQVEVQLSVSGQAATLRIADDGGGIAARGRRSGRGDVTERAASLDGTLEICPNQPHGTVLE